LLVHFNPELEIVLTTDACNTAVAGILSHKFEDGSLKPIAFVSRALQSSERNYSTVEKEALAIVFSVNKLRQYLLGNRFTLRTDHKPLLILFGECKGLPLMTSARIQRWALNLSGFDYSVEYVKGSVNEADSLSRVPQVPLTQTQTEECSYVNFVAQHNHLNLNFQCIARLSRRDPILSKVIKAIEHGTIQSLDKEFQPFIQKHTELSIEDGCLMWGYRTIVPKNFTRKFLNLYIDRI